MATATGQKALPTQTIERVDPRVEKARNFLQTAADHVAVMEGEIREMLSDILSGGQSSSSPGTGRVRGKTVAKMGLVSESHRQMIGVVRGLTHDHNIVRACDALLKHLDQQKSRKTAMPSKAKSVKVKKFADLMAEMSPAQLDRLVRYMDENADDVRRHVDGSACLDAECEKEHIEESDGGTLEGPHAETPEV